MPTAVECQNAYPSANAVIEYKESGRNKEALYSCEEGYFASGGDSILKCVGRGRWYGQRLRCSGES